MWALRHRCSNVSLWWRIPFTKVLNWWRILHQSSAVLVSLSPMITSSHHKCLLKELADRQKRRDKTSLAKKNYVLLLHCLGFIIVAPEGVVFYYILVHLNLLTRTPLRWAESVPSYVFQNNSKPKLLQISTQNWVYFILHQFDIEWLNFVDISWEIF